MHIPDSVLSPMTCAVAGAAMAPVWSISARRVRRSLGTRQMPQLALGAAFCFTIMMFNIPAPYGTTAHPVAGTLLAVMLGPWAACIGISVALLIQALFFGDGGLLAYGANCLSMAFILPFAGYTVYRLLRMLSKRRPGRIPLCAAIGAFVGINGAAAAVAFLLGIQPALFHEANGHAIYFPFGLQITVPAILGAHLLVAGPAEAVVTALVVRYLQTSGTPLYGDSASALSEGQDVATSQRSGRLPASGWLGQPRKRLWFGLMVCVALTPLGLLARGEAWGEWDARGIAEQTAHQFGAGRAYTPKGLAEADAHAYRGVPGLQGYASGDGENRLGYLGAGLLGVGTIAGVIVVGGHALSRRVAVAPQGSEHVRGPAVVARNGLGNADLPDWLKNSSDGRAVYVRTRSPFVERTLAELTGAAASALQSDRWARSPGLLQRLDARCKVVTLGMFILLACLTRRPAVLVELYALALILGVASHLPLALILRRVWLAVPLFVGAIALPLALTAVTPGRELVVLWNSPHISISQPGALLAAALTLRVAVTVTFALVLTWTTRWTDLLQSLRALLVPRMFLSVLAMTYRYLAVTLQTASDGFTARRSRTVGAASDGDGRRFVGVSIGALFGKSLAMAEEVHGAMVSRGFTGEVRGLETLSWKPADALWALAMTALAIAVWTQG